MLPRVQSTSPGISPRRPFLLPNEFANLSGFLEDRPMGIRDDQLEAQRTLCEQYGVHYVPTPGDLKVGINLAGNAYPINGYREALDAAFNELSGWWIWNGERDVSDHGPDFFDALHAAHLPAKCPDVVPYLGLPPGWHFLIAPDYEDVWYDANTVRPRE